MRHSMKNRLMSAALTCAMLLSMPVSTIKAAADDTGKYISEVFIAYGHTEQEAKDWLTSHGWEPVEGDFNAGKDAVGDSAVATVMGIHRTNNPDDAITDMAVMNMGSEGLRGYSFEDYQSLIKEKKAQIDEFVDSFLPAIQEYRNNYNGKGSAAGKARADMAHELLNNIYDGDPNDRFAVNDTGKPLGDLLLHQTRREYGEDKYDKLSKNERTEYADLQQIILESSGASMLVVEQALALAADDGENTWLERMMEISDLSMSEIAEIYADGDSSLSDSAAESLVMSRFGDAASTLMTYYQDIAADLLWYTSYMDNNGLWKADDESMEDCDARVDAHFESLKERDENEYSDLIDKYNNAALLYAALSIVPYEGEWGETLYDFFLPAKGTDTSYADDPASFLPFAAALSEGQRASLQFLSFQALLRVGFDDEEAIRSTMPKIDEVFGDGEQLSIYTGINRAIFRQGVALTSKALMERSMGKDVYGDSYDEGSIMSMVSYCMLAGGIIVLGIGAIMYKTATYAYDVYGVSNRIASLDAAITKGLNYHQQLANEYINTIMQQNTLFQQKMTAELAKKSAQEIQNIQNDINNVGKTLADLDAKMKANSSSTTKMIESKGRLVDEQAAVVKSSNIARGVMTIGGLIMLAAAVVKMVQLMKYYNRDFTMIPLYIVDEADIVTYVTDQDGNILYDASGNPKKNIEFDQFLYYEVVKCNRQDIGVGSDAQDGVDMYEEWGCGDAADLNGDIGKQWLALYTVKSAAKGDPILADSLTYNTVQGNDSALTPAGMNGWIHFFTYNYPADLADEAYAFDNDAGRIYFYWKSDSNAYATASSFSTGQLALAGIGGLALGIFGTTALMFASRKRKDTPEAPTAA